MDSYTWNKCNNLIDTKVFKYMNQKHIITELKYKTGVVNVKRKSIQGQNTDIFRLVFVKIFNIWLKV